MISSRNRALDCAAALAIALAMAGPALALEPADVLAGLARVERSDATFEETRHIAALTAPVIRRGTLRYVRPAELEMIVQTPVPERVRVAGATLTIEGRNGVREVRLADMPAIAGWVESVRATLAGDAPALARHFTVRASGDISRWQLDLTPLSTELAAFVTRVTISGTNAQIGAHRRHRGVGRSQRDGRVARARQAMTRRQGALVALAVLVAAGAWHALRHVTLDSDYSAFLPAGTSDTQRALMRELREGLGSRVVLIALGGAPQHALEQASRKLAAALEQSAAFRYANNGSGSLGQRELALIGEHRYALSDRLDAPHPFSRDALRAALEERLASLASSAGVLDKLLLASDPTAETRRVLARMSPMRSPQRIDGVWFDPEGKRALLVAQTRAFGSDLEGQAGAVAALEQAFAATRTSDAMTLEYSSPGTMAVRSRALIAGDARTLSLVSMAGVLAILAWAYRSPAVVALCVLPAVCGLLAGVVIVDAGFGSIHGITLAFGATLLGEAVDYPTYLLTQMREGASAHEVTARIGRLLGLAVLDHRVRRVRAPVQRISRPRAARRHDGCRRARGGRCHALGAAARRARELAPTPAATMGMVVAVGGAIVAPRLALGIGHNRDGVRDRARVAAAVVGRRSRVDESAAGIGQVDRCATACGAGRTRRALRPHGDRRIARTRTPPLGSAAPCARRRRRLAAARRVRHRERSRAERRHAGATAAGAARPAAPARGSRVCAGRPAVSSRCVRRVHRRRCARTRRGAGHGRRRSRIPRSASRSTGCCGRTAAGGTSSCLLPNCATRPASRARCRLMRVSSTCAARPAR